MIKLLIFLTFFASFQALANSKLLVKKVSETNLDTKKVEVKFVASDKQFSFEKPKTWKVAYDLFGTPLTFLSPKKDKSSSRAVIMVSPVPTNKIKFDTKSLKSFKKHYRKGRRKWISKQVKGEALVFFDEGFYSVNKKETGIKAGYRYRLGKKTFDENTYYFTCNKKFYHVKTMVEMTARPYLEELDAIVRSFKCSE